MRKSRKKRTKKLGLMSQNMSRSNTLRKVMFLSLTKDNTVNAHLKLKVVTGTVLNTSVRMLNVPLF